MSSREEIQVMTVVASEAGKTEVRGRQRLLFFLTSFVELFSQGHEEPETLNTKK